MKTIPILLAIAAALALLPVDAAPGPHCTESCTVPSAGAGYVPPVIVVTSGASVNWESLDVTHINFDGLQTNGAQCFTVTYGATSPSAYVTFQISAGTLTAQVDDESKECVNATPTEAGFILPYFCSLHPPMRGAILVTEV